MKAGKIEEIIGYTLLLLVVGIPMVLGVWAYRSFFYRNVELSLFNNTPYEIEYVLAHPISKTEWKTGGWYTLQPGEHLKFQNADHPRDVEPEYYLYAYTTNREFVQWLHKSDFQENSEPVILWQGNDIQRRVANQKLDFTTDPNGRAEYPSGSYSVGMMKIPNALGENGKDKENKFAWIFRAPVRFKNIELTGNDQDSVAKASIEAKQLADSLHRQMKHQRTWHSYQSFPFHMGVHFVDHNGRYEKGVTLIPSFSNLPTGQLMPFAERDILFALNERPVYSSDDVTQILYEHGIDYENGGIERPLRFVILRNGETYSGQTTYWFDQSYWMSRPSAPTEGGTLLWSAWDGAFFGLGEEFAAGAVKGLEYTANLLEFAMVKLDKAKKQPEYINGPSYKQLRWGYAQVEAMRRHWYPDAYKVGEFSSLAFSLPRAGVKRLGGKAAKFAGSTGGRITFEVTENVLWSFTDGSPLRTTEELIEELGVTLPIAAAAGAVPGVFKKITN